MFSFNSDLPAHMTELIADRSRSADGASPVYLFPCRAVLYTGDLRRDFRGSEFNGIIYLEIYREILF